MAESQVILLLSDFSDRPTGIVILSWLELVLSILVFLIVPVVTQ